MYKNIVVVGFAIDNFGSDVKKLGSKVQRRLFVTQLMPFIQAFCPSCRHQSLNLHRFQPWCFLCRCPLVRLRLWFAFFDRAFGIFIDLDVI